jgi:hypothetical protein
MAKKKYDFSGWATRNDIKCSDGRTIRRDAFKENDGNTVPLVWNHDHSLVDNVLGHALLENRLDGVYAYCSFNETEQGKVGKELVRHGDICSLSIYANKLKQNGSDVIHGAIREVSLVLAGANPGAYIETVIAHSDTRDEEACIFNPSETLELSHEDAEGEEDKKDQESEDKTMGKEKETQKETPKEKELEHKEESEETVQDVVDSMSEKQKNVMFALIGEALEQQKEKQKETKEGEEGMKHNLFDKKEEQEDVLTHAEVVEIITDAKRNGSMKEAFIAHGIENVDYLFPEVQAVNRTPEMIQRDMGWVQKVMSAVHKTPFSRIKSTGANITADEARAKGYVKGKQKVEEVVTSLKRTTTPTTVYKLQKMDRDDVLDITDFDVIAWLKSEMRVMLDEEIARAILIGDGRSPASDDKINPSNIRPILGDSAVYSIPKILVKASGETDYVFAKNFIKEVIKSRKEYKGSGNPTLFTTEDMLTDMLLIEDTNGRVIYDTIEKLTTALRVKDIVTVPVMENLVRTDEAEAFDFTCLAILVNLSDYNVGADKGGAVNMFDDFDINYNKYEYLIETRCSGALIKPYAAITFELKTTHVAG